MSTLDPSLAITATNIQKAYIAYFGRPADPEGMMFWMSAANMPGVTMVNVMDNFAKSAEFQALYPNSTNLYALVNSIYVNLFGRAADSAGANFFVNGLATGQTTIGNVAYEIARGAQGTDLTALNNKVAYSTAFTSALQSNAPAAAAYDADTISMVRSVVTGVLTAGDAATATAGINSLITNIITADIFTLTADAPAIIEGNDGSRQLTFTLTLDKAPPAGLTVSYQTLNTGSATAGDDFTSAAGTVTFAAGQRVATVSVSVSGDMVVESNETVQVQFSGAKLAASVTASGTITNDDNNIGAVTDGNVSADSVVENAAAGTTVGITAVAVDPDAGSTVTYSLSSNPGGLFAINSTTGVVTLAGALNFESTTSHAITVLATSSDGSTSSQAFTVAVTNGNEAPVFTPVSQQVSVQENLQISVTVVTGTATDVDAGDTQTYSLSGADAALFNINAATGAVSFKAPPNFELPLAASGTNAYSFNIVATDAGGLTATQAVIVNVTNVNESFSNASDTIMGGDGDDTFYVGNNELGAGDVLNGGAGNDTLVISLDARATPLDFAGFTLTSIERIVVTNDGTGMATFDLSGSGNSTLVSDNSSQTVVFNNAKAGTGNATNLELRNLTNTAGVTLDIRNSDVTGSTDRVNLLVTSSDNLGGANVGAIAIDTGIETVSLSTAGSASSVTIATLDTDLGTPGTGARTLEISSAVATTITNTLDSFVNTVSGAGSTGGLSFSVANASTGTTLTTGSGADNVTGSANNDSISVAGGNNTVVGSGGNDTVTAADGNNTITTTGGDDSITVGNGINVINAGNGTNTVVVGSGNNTVTTGSGVDTVTGLGGNNNVSTGDSADSVTLGDGANTVNGGSGNDVITLGGGNNVVDAGNDNDTVTTGNGNNSVTLGSGLDTVTTGSGNDTIIGGAFFDASFATLIPLTPRDSISAGAGTDELRINAGSADANFQFVSSVETLTLQTAGTTVLQGANIIAPLTSFAQTAGIVTINGLNAGNDVVDASTFSSALTVNLSSGSDTVTTGSGNDVFNVSSLDDTDALNAAAGSDTLNIDATTTLSTASLFTGFETMNLDTKRNDAVGADTGGNAYSLTLDNDNAPNPNVLSAGILAINASTLADDTDGPLGPLTAETLTFNGSAISDYQVSVTGGAANDTITSGQRNDTIDSGAGADLITLVSGNNLVMAGAGIDSVVAGTGNDNVDAGADADTINVGANLTSADTITGGDATDTITTATGYADAAFLNVRTVEVLQLTAAVNTTLGANAQTAGIVTVQGAAGGETIDASGYTTVGLTINGNGGNDTITSGAGNDSVTTTGGNDLIVTNAGNDTVVSGAGDDNISLGAGADVARFSGSQLDGNDTVAGGADADTVELNNAAGGVTATVNLTNVTGVETFRLSSSGDQVVGVDADANSLTFTAGTVGTITPVTVDASALTDTDDSFSVTLATGTSANYQFTIVGSATGDTFEKQNSGANNNVLFAGNGGNDNAIFRGGDLGANITIEGGAGTDTLTQNGGVFIDDDFQNVSSIEVLTAQALTALSATLGVQADRIGLSSITGGAGNDRVVLDAAFGSTTTALSAVLGAGGDDTINAGATNTVMTFLSNAASITGADVLTGGLGTGDRYLVTTDNGTSNLSGMSGVETITIVETTGNEGAGLTITNATFTGVASNRITINASDLDDSTATDGIVGGLTVNAGGVTTGGFDLTAGNGDDNLTTGGGDDVINLGLGNDAVNSGAGNDTITNLDGDKTIDAGTGDDSVTLGNGNNTVVAGTGNDTVVSGNGNNMVSGGDGNDSVTLGNGNNVVSGGIGNDTVVAGNGSNSIDLGAGDDTLTVGGTALPLTANTITGGAGADVITLGAGQDFLRVTAVADSVGLTRDTVTGFTTGTDRIVIETQAVSAGVNATFNAASVTAANAFSSTSAVGVNFAGNANDFSDAQGAISLTANDGKADYVFQKDTNKLWIDVNDDGILNGLDIQVTLAGVTAMSAGDVTLRDTIAPTFPAEASTISEVRLSATQAPAGATVAGNLDAIDTDGGAVTYTSVAGAGFNVLTNEFTRVGTFGTLALNATTGAYVYTKNNAAIEALDDGETGSDVFTVVATDNVGLTTTSTYTVTVNGADDQPTLAATVDGTIVETAFSAATTTGNLTGTLVGADVDVETLTYGLTGGTPNFDVFGDLISFSRVGTFGTLTVTIADGSYTYAPNAAAVESVAVTEAPTDVFTVTVSDGDDADVSTTYTVTVTGGNDNPTLVVVNAAGAVTEDLNINTGNLLSSGAITFDDVDLTDTHTVAVVAGTDAAGLSGVLTATINTQATGAGVGSLQWNYSVSNAVTQKLAEAQTATQTFTVTVSDNRVPAGTVSQVVTVTVTGTNDVPTIVVASTDAVGAVTEDATNPTLTDTGTITFQDVDVLNTSDAHTVTVTPNAGGYLGTLTLGSITDTTTVSNTGTVAWTFTLANSAAQSLADGQVVTQLYTVRFTDNRNAFVEQTVSVTITGTNDAPEFFITALDSDAGGITETDAGALTATGTLTIVDVDLTDTVAASVTGVVPSGVTTGAPLGLAAMLTVTGGAIPADSGTLNNLTWTFNSGAATFDYLADGEQLVLTYTVSATDGIDTDTTPVTITVTGTNDVPVVAATDVTGAVTELVTPAGNLTDTGTITFTDLDLTDAHSISAVTPSVGALGALTATVTTDTTGTGLGGVVTWNYSVDASAVEFLADGETKVETFQFNVEDGNGGTVSRTVSVTVTGTNDAPVVAATDVTAAVTELVTPVGNLTDTGTIAFTDVDLTDVHTIGPVTASLGAEGVFTASVTTDTTTTGLGGVVTWNFEVAASAVEELAAGETQVQTYLFDVLDGEGGSVSRTVTATITGTNDAPVISVGAGDSATAALTETNATLASAGTLTVVDVDFTNTVTITRSVVQSGVTGGVLDATVLTMMGVTAGPLNANAGDTNNIAWTFNSGAEAFNYLAAGEVLTLTYTITATDSSAVPATATQDVVVTITGTNDAPTIALGTVSATSFTVNAADVDASDSLSLVTAVNGLVALNNGSATSINVQQQGAPTVTDIQVTDGTVNSAVLLSLVQGTALPDDLAPTLNTGLYYGFDGDDNITGGTLSDTMVGGAGLDTFVLVGNTGAVGMDVITDFTLADDSIDAVVSGAGFTYVDATALTEAAILAILGTGDRAVATGTDATQFHNVNGSGDSIILFDDLTGGTWDAAVKLVGVVADVTGTIV